MLDACAAPGGKTAHLLERQPKLAGVVAVDAYENRLKRVQENLDRIGLTAKVTGNNSNNGNIITFTVPGHLSDSPTNNCWNPDTLAVFDYTQCLPAGDYTGESTTYASLWLRVS